MTQPTEMSDLRANERPLPIRINPQIADTVFSAVVIGQV